MKLAMKRKLAIELVCRQLRGYWHFKMVNWLKGHIRAVIVVQKCWRMYKGIVKPLII